MTVCPSASSSSLEKTFTFPLTCPGKSTPMCNCFPPTLYLWTTFDSQITLRWYLRYGLSSLTHGSCPTMAVNTELERNHIAVTQMFLFTLNLSKFDLSCLFLFTGLFWKGTCLVFPLILSESQIYFIWVSESTAWFKGSVYHLSLHECCVTGPLHTSKQTHHFCRRKPSLLRVAYWAQSLPWGQECQHFSTFTTDPAISSQAIQHLCKQLGMVACSTKSGELLSAALLTGERKNYL